MKILRLARIYFAACFLVQAVMLAQSGPSSRKDIKDLLVEIQKRQEELALILAERMRAASSVADIKDIIACAEPLTNSPKDQLLATVGYVLQKRPDAIRELGDETLKQIESCLAPRVDGGQFLASLLSEIYVAKDTPNGYLFDRKYYQLLRAPDPETAALLAASANKAQQRVLALAFVRDAIKFGTPKPKP